MSKDISYVNKFKEVNNKVSHADMDTLPFIIALDFDGTLVDDRFPKIGRTNWTMVGRVKALQEVRPDIKWVLWTCRTGQPLQDAIDWCEQNEIKIDAVNRNIDEVISMFSEDTRKVYANLYVDDKNTSLWLVDGKLV